jgi:ribonuclease PH
MKHGKTPEGNWVAIPGPREHAEFSRGELNELLDLAEGGLYDLVDLQRAALDAELGDAVTLGEWN